MSTVLIFCLLKWDFIAEMILLSARLNTSVKSPASSDRGFLNNLHTIKDQFLFSEISFVSLCTWTPWEWSSRALEGILHLHWHAKIRATSRSQRATFSLYTSGQKFEITIWLFHQKYSITIVKISFIPVMAKLRFQSSVSHSNMLVWCCAQLIIVLIKCVFSCIIEYAFDKYH